MGFHWALEHFLDEILDQMHERSVGAFTLHDRVTAPEEIGRRVPCRVVEFRRSWPRGRWTRMLVLSRSEEELRDLEAT